MRELFCLRKIPKRLGICHSMFGFQGAYINGAAIDSPGADGYTHERPPRYGGGWTCTSGGLWPSALRVYLITSLDGSDIANTYAPFCVTI